ncbi:MAG TPA: SRPBCC family protein [Thermoleophilaceae bacterium]|nr:SRPBCC family protein [Thermoleophilaceae bacterium]
MTAAHPVRPVDDSFLTQAPIVIESKVDFDAPPTDVWEALGSDRMWSWLPVLDQLRWLSPRPLTQGAVRTLRVARLFTIEEHFYRWEEPRRATFHVTSSTRPTLHALAEDFLLEPTSDGGTRLTWTMALEPRPSIPGPLGRLLSLLLRPGNTWAIGGLRRILPRR